MIAGLVLITSGIVLFVFNLIFCLQTSERSCYRGNRADCGLCSPYSASRYKTADEVGVSRDVARGVSRGVARGGSYINGGATAYPVYDEPDYNQVTIFCIICKC